MTMLEKAAVALMNRQRKSHGLPPIGAEMFDAEEIEYAKDLARAVLMAVREPGAEIRSGRSFSASERDWPAMIDAILNEGSAK